MNIILLSGGSGSRLWPMSNDVRSKQFIKLFKGEDGAYESMLQRMYRGILEVDREAVITIATSKSQVSAITNQIGEGISISLEPCRRDTFPAIALASAYLHDVKGLSKEEPVVVCPVDPYVERDYFEALGRLSELAETGSSNLTLLGISPTYPSEKYGYILPDSKEEVSRVVSFKEKPDEETARDYIRQGALWNGGIFAYKLSYVLDRAHELMDFTDYDDLFSKYETLEKISFDYAVVEREKSIGVLRFSGMWKDLGTWNTLTEAMPESAIGNVTMDKSCRNSHILNAMDVPVLGVGLENLVVAVSPDGVLVADKESSSYIKPYVDSFHQQVMYAEKSWGSYQVLDAEEESLTIKVTLRAGSRMNYHSHERRDEVWTIISGAGRTIIDGMEQLVGPGDVVTMQAGCRHMILAESDLKLIEVQLGKDIDVRDKIKYESPLKNPIRNTKIGSIRK